MWSDSEGGNLTLIAPDGTRWEMDAFNGNARLFKHDPVIGFTFDKNGTFSAHKDVLAQGIRASWGFMTPLGSNGLMFGDEGRIWSPSAQHLYFRASPEAEYCLHLGVHDNMWTFDGDVNNRLALGSPNHRWTQLYVAAGSISSSDGKLKKDIKTIPEIYEHIFQELNPVIYKFKEGTSDRIHTGFISQEVESTLIKHGISTKDWAAICKDKDESGEGNIYGLRYEEIIALNTHMIQKLYKEINELKSLLK